jgi:hypothetical protein
MNEMNHMDSSASTSSRIAAISADVVTAPLQLGVALVCAPFTATYEHAQKTGMKKRMDEHSARVALLLGQIRTNPNVVLSLNLAPTNSNPETEAVRSALADDSIAFSTNILRYIFQRSWPCQADVLENPAASESFIRELCSDGLQRGSSQPPAALKEMANWELTERAKMKRMPDDSLNWLAKCDGGEARRARMELTRRAKVNPPAARPASEDAKPARVEASPDQSL